MSELRALISAIGDIEGWLLVLDFDGTLSPIVDHPQDGALTEGATEALAALAERTTVVVLSGRGLEDLHPRLGELAVTIAGGHGAEVVTPDGAHTALIEIEAVTPTLRRVTGELEQLIGERTGWEIEVKPASVAVHHRRASGPDTAEVLEHVRSLLVERVQDPPGFELLAGKAVLELRPRAVDKGRAVDWLVARWPGRAPLVIGDDVTDEQAFTAALAHGGDAVLVADCPRDTAANWRLDDPDEVVALLRALTRPQAD